MKIRAQIAMVLNLDKCIGCHTCSVTCKNVWTNREGMEYAWFNNVETKPGIGYPKDWENQKRWNGGWVRKRNGKIQPRSAASGGCWPTSSPTPTCRRSTTTTSRSPSTTSTCRRRPSWKAFPTARPRSLITGERMEKIEWGPNWEEILGGEFAKRSQDANFEGVQKEMYGQFENTFMMYLPRLCEHCLNPACVGGLPLGRHLQARGGRHRPDRPGQVPRLAHVRLGLPLQEDLLQLVERQVGEVHLLLPAHRGGPADRLLGNLRRAHPLSRRHALRRRPHRGGGQRAEGRAGPLPRAADGIFLDPNDPAVIAQARADGMPDAWLEAARRSPV
jgi:nitrate reductase beta subunit